MVIGSSGAGKSHLIRWFDAKIERQKPESEVVLFVRRSDNTLKGTIKQLLEKTEVASIPNKELYERLVNASHIEQNEYEIDHFVPWSFVTNDEMWNLIPVNPSLNASKRDKLPNWDRYFLSFAQNQFRLNQMVYKYERLAHIFRECQRDNLNAAWSVEELYVKNIKNDQFCKVLESRLKPIYELARTQGYRIWMVGE